MTMFIRPNTKFGFARIFGQETGGRILRGFLNAVFEGRYHVDEVIYRDAEVISGADEERRVIHSVFCLQKNDEPIILEWQNRDIVDSFHNRVHFFQAASIASLEVENVDNWRQIPLFVYILDFVQKDFDEDFRIDTSLAPHFITEYECCYCEENCDGDDECDDDGECDDGEDDEGDEGELYPDGELEHMVYLQLPEFNKSESDCITDLDKWLYILKNLANLDAIPWTDENADFAELAKLARIDGMTAEERAEYEKSCAILAEYGVQDS